MLINGLSQGPATVASSFAFVQSSCTAGPGNTVRFVTMASSVTAGNIIFVSGADTGEGFTSSTDTFNNTYTNYTGGSGNGSARAEIYVSTNIKTGGANDKVTIIAGAGANVNVCVSEYTSGGSKDVTKTASATGTNATSGNYSTTGTTDLCVAMLAHSGSDGVVLTQAGTLIAKDQANATEQAYSNQYTTPASGANASTWTNVSIPYVIDVVCIK